MKRKKPEVIDISDDETKPSAKKRAEPVPSHEVPAIHEKLAKLANKEKQSAIRIAAELQARVEFLENLIDEKPAPFVEKKKKVAKNELKKRVTYLTKQLEKEKWQAQQIRSKYDTELSSLTKQLEEQRARANKDRKRDRVRIDDLTRKLAEGAKQTNNIFELLPTGATGTMPYAWTRSSLKHAEKLIFRTEAWHEERKKCYKDESLYCALCKKTFKNEEILDHFYSLDHSMKMRPRTASVSLDSFNYWDNKMHNYIPSHSTGAKNRSSSDEYEE